MGTENTSARWKPGTSNLSQRGPIALARPNQRSPLVTGHNVLLFADVASPTLVKPAVPFDLTNLLSMLHVPTKPPPGRIAACASTNLAVVTGP